MRFVHTIFTVLQCTTTHTKTRTTHTTNEQNKKKKNRRRNDFPYHFQDAFCFHPFTEPLARATRSAYTQHIIHTHIQCLHNIASVIWWAFCAEWTGMQKTLSTGQHEGNKREKYSDSKKPTEREREREETQTQYTQYSRRKKNVLRLTFIWLCDIFFHLYRLIQHWYCTHNEHRNVLWMATRTTNSRSSSTYTNTNNRPSSVRYSPALERNHDPMQRIYIYNMYVKWNTSKNCTRDVAMGGCVAALCTEYIIICHWPPLHIIHVMFIAILLWFIYFR